HAELEVELLCDGVGEVDVEARVPGAVVPALELEGDVGHFGADRQRARLDEAVVGAGSRGVVAASVAVGTRVAGAAGQNEHSGGRDGGAEKQRTTVHGHSCVTGLAPRDTGFIHLGMCSCPATTARRVPAVT